MPDQECHDIYIFSGDRMVGRIHRVTNRSGYKAMCGTQDGEGTVYYNVPNEQEAISLLSEPETNIFLALAQAGGYFFTPEHPDQL